MNNYPDERNASVIFKYLEVAILPLEAKYRSVFALFGLGLGLGLGLG